MNHFKILFVFLLLSSCRYSNTLQEKETPPIKKERRASDCELTFTVWQKDAYSYSGGRNKLYFPVHTSTSLTIHCQNEEPVVWNLPNHGAVPGDKDKDGRMLLDEMSHQKFSVKKEKAQSFLEAYKNSSCDTFNKFLSLEDVQDGAQNFIYRDDFKEKMKEEFAAQLKKKGYDEASTLILSFLPNQLYDQNLEKIFNKVKDPKEWISLFTHSWIQTMNHILKKDSSQYHVCNNDATVSHLLWQNLKNGKSFDKKEEFLEQACKGPILFFESSIESLAEK